MNVRHTPVSSIVHFYFVILYAESWIYKAGVSIKLQRHGVFSDPNNGQQVYTKVLFYSLHVFLKMGVYKKGQNKKYSHKKKASINGTQNPKDPKAKIKWSKLGSCINM